MCEAGSRSPRQDYSFTVLPVSIGGDSLCSPFFVEIAAPVAPTQLRKALPDAPPQLPEAPATALARPPPRLSSEAAFLWNWVCQQRQHLPEAVSSARAWSPEATHAAPAGPPEPSSEALGLWRWLDQRGPSSLEVLSGEPARPPRASSVRPGELRGAPARPPEARQLFGEGAGPRLAPPSAEAVAEQPVAELAPGAERLAAAERAREADLRAAGRPPEGGCALKAELRAAARPPEVQALQVKRCHATSVELEWIVPEQEVGCFHVSVYRRDSAARDGAEARRLELVRVEVARRGEPLARQRLAVGGLTPGTSYMLEVVSSKADRTSVAVRVDACTCGPLDAPGSAGRGPAKILWTKTPLLQVT
ncbi:unnamed protein product [Prorocentrum cordatum]|uniref:Fibronectin type-III domain-containing protein n=1 Tax=Prorocentrum cordatum TaxID=2364126 RepID=A0ABN9VA88_9DINO|nr:unnamed protein product [Polarella glacialis]